MGDSQGMLTGADVWGGRLEEICVINWRWGQSGVEAKAGDLP